jgi:predicted TIM-barrel fold metal-dependent hydrolase
MLVDNHLHVSGEIGPRRLLAYMDRAGLDRAILLGSSQFTLTLDHHDGFVNHSDNNTYILRLARDHPDRLAAWPTLDPRERQNSWRVRSYADKGATGIKLYVGHGARNAFTGEPIFHVCRIDDDRMLPIYEACAERDLPICLHVNCGIADYWAELLHVLAAFRDVKFVIPHFALSTRAPERLRFLFEQFPNVFSDISFGQDEFLLAGSVRVEQSAKLRALVYAYSERFLFGADLVLTDTAHKTPQWMADRVEHYRSMLTKQRYWSKPFQRTFRGFALSKPASRAIMDANIDRLGAVFLRAPAKARRAPDDRSSRLW